MPKPVTSRPEYGRRAIREDHQRSLHSLTLAGAGISSMVMVVLSVVALFPMVGLIIGWYYSTWGHIPTRKMGQALFWSSLFLHIVYFCVLCPLTAYVALQQL